MFKLIYLFLPVTCIKKKYGLPSWTLECGNDTKHYSSCPDSNLLTKCKRNGSTICSRVPLAVGGVVDEEEEVVVYRDLQS